MFFVLLLLGAILPGEPPAFDAPDDEVVEYVTDDTSTLELASFISVLGLPLFAVLAVGLARAAAPQAGTDARGWAVVGTIGAASTLGLVGAASGVNGLLLSRADTLADTPEIAGLLFDLANSGFVIAAVLFATYLVGIGLAIVRGGALPAWLGWAAVAIAVPSVVGGAFVHDALANEGLGFVGFIGFLLFALWNLVASIVLLRQSRAGTTTAPQAA